MAFRYGLILIIITWAPPTYFQGNLLLTLKKRDGAAVRSKIVNVGWQSIILFYFLHIVLDSNAAICWERTNLFACLFNFLYSFPFSVYDR